MYTVKVKHNPEPDCIEQPWKIQVQDVEDPVSAIANMFVAAKNFLPGGPCRCLADLVITVLDLMPEDWHYDSPLGDKMEVLYKAAKAALSKESDTDGPGKSKELADE